VSKSALDFLRFDKNFVKAICVVCVGIIIVFLPQIFTFWGRAGYLSFHPLEPVLWFTRKDLIGATWGDWMESLFYLAAELAPLLFIAFCALPVYIFSLCKSKPFAGIIIISLGIVTILSLSFIRAATYDWYWRGGNFALIILPAASSAWLFSFLPYQKGGVKTGLSWGLALLFFIPGMLSFFNESLKRYKNCVAAPEAAQMLNRNIGLHTAVGYFAQDSAAFQREPIEVSRDHPWWHARYGSSLIDVTLYSKADVILTLVNQAGRIGIGWENPLWIFLDVYSLPPVFLREHFGWQGVAGPCGKTWFGASIPQNTYAKIISLEPLKFEMKECAK
jgi:hypothetical protein